MILQKKIVIFTSDLFGLKIYNYIKKYKKYRLYLVIPKKNKLLEKRIKELNISKFEYYENLIKKNKLLKFKKLNFDLLISVYFNRIFKKDIYKSVKKTINFHPSYLPHHKGCYPHVHAMLSGIGGGITFHQIQKKIDSGKIWFQKKLSPKLMDTQENFHNRLKNEMLKKFKKNFKSILYDKIEPKNQSSNGNYNNKNSLNKYDKLILNKNYKLSNLIQLLNARKFKTKTFAYFKYKNKRFKILMKVL